jgi:RimJ/RimL family protein N-acetyltransferase
MCSAFHSPAVNAVIDTPRLKLRPTRRQVARRVADRAAHFDVARMTVRIPHPYTDEQAQGFITRMGEPGRFAIEHAQDGLVGVLGFHDTDRFGAPELGYWLGRPYWGQGLATEAVSAALVWARDEWGRKVVRAGHFADNDASANVLIKSDFLYTGEVVEKPSLARGGVAPTRMMVWLA